MLLLAYKSLVTLGDPNSLKAIMDEYNVITITGDWLAQFSWAADSADVVGVVALFLSSSWLRNVLVFTWTHHSLHGHDAIFNYLSNHLSQANIRNVKLDKDHGIQPNYNPEEHIIKAALTFETPIAYGRGLIRLLKDQDGKWKAFTVFLTLDDIKGHEEKGPESGYYDGHTRTWNEVHEEEKARIEKEPHVIIGEHL